MANEISTINGAVTKREENGDFRYDFPKAVIIAIPSTTEYIVRHVDDPADRKALFADITDPLGASDIEGYCDALANLGAYF